MWPFDTKRIKAAVQEAVLIQAAHEKDWPEPYDYEQRHKAISIRAKYLLKQKGLRQPANLADLIHSVVIG